MSVRSRVTLWARCLVQGRRVRSEMDEEMRFHVAARAADLEREGKSAKEAQRQARVEFGSVAAHEDRARAALGLRWVDEWTSDVRYGWRVLRKAPSFTAVAVISLALAIGANSTVFSLANEMLYARLGVPRPTELRSLLWTLDAHNLSFGYAVNYGNNVNGKQIANGFSYPVYKQLEAAALPQAPLFAVHDEDFLSIAAHGAPFAGRAELVSGNFFEQMEVQPRLGRVIQPSDDSVSAPLVAVISDRLWRSAYDGSPNVAGQQVRVDRNIFTIVGVAPAGFTGANSPQSGPDVFLPLSSLPLFKPVMSGTSPFQATDYWWLQVMVRQPKGLSEAQMTAPLRIALHSAGLATLTKRKNNSVPELLTMDGSRGVDLMSRLYQKPMNVMLGLVALVLLLACVNIANLMLARSSTREREIAVRLALGAGRRRIFRQFITECLLLACMGGAAGFVFAYFARSIVPSMLSIPIPEDMGFRVPFAWNIFAFTAAITIASGLISGLAPALRATRSESGDALQQAGRNLTRRTTFWRSKGLVMVQVALSTLLIVVSALFLHTVMNLQSIDPGFHAKGLLLADVNLPSLRYPDAKSIAMHRQLLAAVRAIPGVDGASLTNVALISGSEVATDFHVLGGPTIKDDAGPRYATVGSDFLRVMGIPLLAGRDFSASDLYSTQQVAIVSKALAAQSFPHTNPIGHRFRAGDAEKGPLIEIIGVCGDVRYSSLKRTPPPLFFDLYTKDESMNSATYVLRTHGDPKALAASVRKAVARFDPDLPVNDIRTQEEQDAQDVQLERMLAGLAAGFGVLALCLACVGIYGVLSYRVAERTHELGIRLALGAARERLRLGVLQEAAFLASAGIVAGLGVAVLLMRVVRSLLYEIHGVDWVSLVVPGVLLLGVALVSAWVPAVRASGVEPMEALRHE